MAKKKTSHMSLRTRLLVLIPLPVIAVAIFWAGSQPREGLFESEPDAAWSATTGPLSLPADLPSSGFVLADTVQHFDADNLYLKINGHDVTFFRFGFELLTFASYAGEADAFIDVYAYRMTGRPNALGVYAFERADDRENLGIADAGYTAGGATFFYRGPYYVQVIPAGKENSTAPAMAEILDSLRVVIPAPVEPLSALSWFPDEHRVSNSDGYFPDNAFGTDFVSDIYTTDYELDGSTATVFLHRSDTAQNMYERYGEFLTENAESEGVQQVAGQELVTFLDYGDRVWLFQFDSYFGGLLGDVEISAMKTLAANVVNHLRRSAQD